MLSRHYLPGILFAVSAGVLNYLGLTLQKKAVNGVPMEKRGKGFMKTLLLNPLWVLGLFLYIGLSTVFFMIAQYMIGPSLVPGITAAGLVVLVFAAFRIVGEEIGVLEIAGILILIAGVVLLTASELVIDSVRIDLSDRHIVFRIFLFSFLLFAAWMVMDVLCLKSVHKKALFKGLASGFPYCISNLWIAVLYASMFPVFNGNTSMVLIFFFILSSIVLIVSNIFGISEIQKAFTYGKVSMVIPIQQIPVQSAPVFYFYFVFMLKSPKIHSCFYVGSGIILIIISGFFLGKTHEVAESIKSNEP